MFKSKTQNTKTYNHRITHVCYFLDIVLEHANSNVSQIESNAWAYITKCVKMQFEHVQTCKDTYEWYVCVCLAL